MKSKLAGALELSRGLQTYNIAADLVGYDDANFKAKIRELIYAKIQGHSGGDGVFGTAVQSPTNWVGMRVRASESPQSI